jgi:hypothetical protein
MEDKDFIDDRWAEVAGLESLGFHHYIGVKEIAAKPMNLGDYNAHRKWPMPDNEDPARDGYLVRYFTEDAYQSWSPKEVFEEAYRRTNGLSFGLAIEAAKKGRKVTRRSWNSKDDFVYYVPADFFPAATVIAKKIYGDTVPYQGYLALSTKNKEVQPFIPRMDGMLADDWQIIP